VTEPLPPVRFSTLKYMSRSPAHYRHALLNPPAQSRPMRLGSAVDAELFGTKKVVVSECTTRRGKAWDAFAESYPDAICLTPSEADAVTGMVKSLRAHQQASELFAWGSSQLKLEWSMARRNCAGTPDLISNFYCVELKTCRNAHPDFFQYDARKLAYHAQLDWYMNAHEQIMQKRPKHAYIVAVENVAPYVVTVFEVTERALLEGRKLWTLWFERLRVCEASNEWPGYVQSATPFDVPDSDSLTLQIDGEEVEV